MFERQGGVKWCIFWVKVRSKRVRAVGCGVCAICMSVVEVMDGRCESVSTRKSSQKLYHLLFRSVAPQPLSLSLSLFSGSFTCFSSVKIHVKQHSFGKCSHPLLTFQSPIWDRAHAERKRESNTVKMRSETHTKKEHTKREKYTIPLWISSTCSMLRGGGILYAKHRIVITYFSS